MWAPVVARMALILLPARPITREIALTGTCTFLQVISGCVEVTVVVVETPGTVIHVDEEEEDEADEELAELVDELALMPPVALDDGGKIEALETAAVLDDCCAAELFLTTSFQPSSPRLGAIFEGCGFDVIDIPTPLFIMSDSLRSSVANFPDESILDLRFPTFESVFVVC